MDDTELNNNNQSGLTGWIKLHRQIIESEVFQDQTYYVSGYGC